MRAGVNPAGQDPLGRTRVPLVGDYWDGSRERTGLSQVGNAQKEADMDTTKTFEDGLRAAKSCKNKATLVAAVLDLRAQMPVVEFQPTPRAAKREELEILYASACVALADELEIRQAAIEACAIVNGGGGRILPSVEVEILQAEDLEVALQAESDAAWAGVIESAPPEALVGPAVSPPRPTESQAVVVGTCPHVVDERGEIVTALEAVLNGRHADLTGLLPRARRLLGRTDLVRRVEELFIIQLDVEQQRARASALRARAQRRTFVPGGTASTAAALRRIDGERRAGVDGATVGDLYPDLARRERRPAEL